VECALGSIREKKGDRICGARSLFHQQGVAPKKGDFSEKSGPTLSHGRAGARYAGDGNRRRANAGEKGKVGNESRVDGKKGDVSPGGGARYRRHVVRKEEGPRKRLRLWSPWQEKGTSLALIEGEPSKEGKEESGRAL